MPEPTGPISRDDVAHVARLARLSDIERDPRVTLLADRYPIGSHIRARVRNVTNFGVFVGIEEGIDVLLAVEEVGADADPPAPLADQGGAPAADREVRLALLLHDPGRAERQVEAVRGRRAHRDAEAEDEGGEAQAPSSAAQARAAFEMLPLAPVSNQRKYCDSKSSVQRSFCSRKLSPSSKENAGPVATAAACRV